MGQSLITNVSKTCMTHDKSLGSKEKILKSGMELYIKMVKLRLRLFKQSHQEKQIMCSRRVSGT